MVGKTQKFNLHGLRKRLHQSVSHDGKGPVEDVPTIIRPAQKKVPLFASPLDPKATHWLKNKHKSGNLTLRRRPTIAQYEADRFSGGIFRKQHEASTLELFFDLFFVANLAVFTANHQHTNRRSVSSYIGFFTILWFTWFHISIFDVRFYVDSVFNRLCKLVQFGVFAAFTGLGPLFDVINNGGNSRSFHAVAMVLMMARLVLFLQYATVLYFVRPFKKTMVPLLLMMAVYLGTALGFLGTFLDDPNGATAQKTGETHLIIWYAIIAAEGLVVIIISSTWRILSFKHTHLVERVGLLTLIIMGEGIIGLTKSTSYLLSGTNISLWSIIGKIVAGVVLIYALYILYFSPIDHDRFGTIRQQVWTLLHYPLHVGILLTEEGSAVTLLWDACIGARDWLRIQLPDLQNPSQGFNSTTQWIESVNRTMNVTATRYHYVKLKDVYDYYPDLYAVKNISDPFGSPGWNNKTIKILNDIFNDTSSFFFQNFNFEKPKKAYTETNADKKLGLYFEAYNTTFTFFYIAAGATLLVMAGMFWIGKNNKTRQEYSAIFTRIIIGIGLPFMVLLAYLHPGQGGFVYTQSGWIVPIVTFAVLFVVTVDNLIGSWADHSEAKHGGGQSPGDDSDIEKSDHHNSSLHGHHADAMAAAQHFGRPKHAHHDSHHGHDDDNDEQTSGHHQPSHHASGNIVEDHSPLLDGPGIAIGGDMADHQHYHDQQQQQQQQQQYNQHHHDHSQQGYQLSDINTSYTAHPKHRTSYERLHDQENAGPYLHHVQFNEPTMASPASPGRAPHTHYGA